MALTAEQIAAFNPRNAKNLTTEELAILQNITDADLKQLAEAYPNVAINNTYILLKDSAFKVGQQIFPESTYPNLYNLRVKSGRKNYSIHTFKELHKPAPKVTAETPSKGPVKDISADEIKQAPGIVAGETKALQETPNVNEVAGNALKEPAAPEAPKKATGKKGKKAVTEEPAAPEEADDFEGEDFPDLSDEAAALGEE